MATLRLGQDVRTDRGSIPAAKQTPSFSPDLYVAGLAAATQVYIDLAMIKGRPTPAAIDALVRRSASQQKLSTAVAAAIHTYLLTSPDAPGVVAQSAALGSSVLAYAKGTPTLSRPITPWSGILDSSQPALHMTSQRDDGSSGSNRPPQPLTGPQAVAAAGAAHHAVPEPIHDPPLEPDELGNALVFFGFGLAVLGEDLCEVLVDELGNYIVPTVTETIVTTLDPNDVEPPDLSNLATPDDGQADLPDEATTNDDAGEPD